MFLVYYTYYSGKLLPPFYIGSTSEGRLSSGYHGSVKSQKYFKIWERELKDNPFLFKTTALSKRYETRTEALKAERRLQILLSVVKSPMYINMAIAAKNGCFGRDTKGENHPLYQKTHSEISRRKISDNHADFSGAKNGRAVHYDIVSPCGKTTKVVGEFKKFCLDNDLPFSTMCLILKGREFKTGKCIGWKVYKINH